MKISKNPFAMLPLLAVLVGSEKAVASSFSAPLHNKELSHSSRRDLQATCTGGQVLNACASCNGCKFTTKNALNAAVNAYSQDKTTAVNTYGEMNCWDVSSITDMYNLFASSPLNEPIGCWNVGSVINMYAMFYKATNFNQHINNWNVGSVTDMYNIFSMLPVSTSLLGIGMSVVLLTWVACFSRLPSSTKIYVHGIISYQVLLHLMIIITRHLFLTVLVVPTKQHLTYK
jgi:surface protein